MCSERSTHAGFFGQKDGSYNSDFQTKKEIGTNSSPGPSKRHIEDSLLTPMLNIKKKKKNQENIC